MNFKWSLPGYDNNKSLILSKINDDLLVNSFLVYGEAKTGKLSFVLDIIKYYYCLNDLKPCHKCVNCHQVAIGVWPEITVIDLLEDKNISVDQVREFNKK